LTRTKPLVAKVSSKDSNRRAPTRKACLRKKLSSAVIVVSQPCWACYGGCYNSPRSFRLESHPELYQRQGGGSKSEEEEEEEEEKKRSIKDKPDM
jgi:hypothetical protein